MNRLRVNKANVMAYLYFFFNNAGLSGGLLYTNVLSPFLYFWLLYKKKQPVLWPYLIVIIPFGIVHMIGGVEIKSFLISNLLLLSTYIFGACVHYFIHHYPQLDQLFKRLLRMNFLFVMIACFIYYTPYRDYLWYMNKLTLNVEGFYRLSLLTFEASYYALIFAPIAVYYILKVFLGLNQTPTWHILILIGLPLLLSLSFGVIGALLLAFIFLYLFHYKRIFYKRNFFKWLIIGSAVLISFLSVMILFFPDAAFMIRLKNIYYGLDTSTKGRTTDSFGIAWYVAQERSIWFGGGLGQIKVLAYDIVKRHYNYWGDMQIVRIPNSVAETLAIFGICGLVFRFGLVFYLFFKTKVLNNFYRTFLFFFIFIYQFTGSYITSSVEYVIWILAFSSVFSQFDVYKNIGEQNK